MVLTREGVFRYAQKMFEEKLVVVVGSGASCAYGLPGMSLLANHLQAKMADTVLGITPQDQAVWDEIARDLKEGVDLESALMRRSVPSTLAETIALLVAECVERSEGAAIASILEADDITPLGRLFLNALRTTRILDVITTNYDRLIEVHAARAEVPVDSMFHGHTVGRLDSRSSHEEQYRMDERRGTSRSPMLTLRPHVRLSKPHGSLDWYTYNGRHYRSDLAMPGARRIVAPGNNKYKLGYETPFDLQRERANKAIDEAGSLIFTGYGFNDEHLQTHMRERSASLPSVVLSMELTTNAREYLRSNPEAIGIEAGPTGDDCVVIQGDKQTQLDTPLWDLDRFLKEALGI